MKKKMAFIAKADLWEGRVCVFVRLHPFAVQCLRSAAFSPAVSLDAAQLQLAPIVIKLCCFPGSLSVPLLPGARGKPCSACRGQLGEFLILNLPAKSTTCHIAALDIARYG